MLLVTTTTGDRDSAERIATELVDRRLAACVQIGGPVTSTYRWQGKIETTEEWVCAAKTREECFGDIDRLMAEIHPYDTPELIATPITHASDAYRAWLESEIE